MDQIGSGHSENVSSPESPPSAGTGTRICEVVVLVHGIRTFANWQPMVKRVLEEIPGFHVVPIKYGYLDAFRFWFPLFTRSAPIEDLRREIQNARAAHPGAAMSVIAHSFGTFAIARILQENPDFVFHHMIFCGSIVPQSYRWDYVRARLETGVLNDFGTRDIWPVLAKSLSWGYGDTGRHGFGRGATVVDRGHNYSHSDFFNEEFVRTYWKPWFQSTQLVASPWEEKAPPTPWCLSVLSILPLQWLFSLLILLVFAAWPLGYWDRLLRPAHADAITFEQMADDHRAPDFVERIDAYKAAHENRIVTWQAIVGKPVPGGYYITPTRPDLEDFNVLAKSRSLDEVGSLREGSTVEIEAVVDDINPASLRLREMKVLRRLSE